MDSQVLWQVILGTSATALITDLIVGLAKKSPPFLIAPYFRLWKESVLLYDVLHNRDFSHWKPQAARYVALRAIKAQGASQESPQPVLDLLESFLKRSEPVVLLGEPGAGKTTALQALTYRLARRALLLDCLMWLALLIGTAMLSFSAPVFTIVWLASFILWKPLVVRFTVPLFIEARSAYSGGDVNEWCEKIFRDRLGPKPLIGTRRRVALFIDGANEVEGSLYGGFVEGWRGRLIGKRACSVIFTSRGGEENPAKRLGVGEVLSVCDLDDDGVREFMKVYGREKASKENKPYNAEQANRDCDELRKKNLLGEGGIGRNPYWLKMVVESGLYTRNRGALFRSFAENLIQREIEEKPEERKHKPDWKIVPVEVEMDALATLALAMHEEKRIGFLDEAGWDKARAAIRKSLGDVPYLPDDVLGEARASTLVRVQFRASVEFVHQLVQEFFSAYALHPEAKWQEALAHCEDVWWWQTLFDMGGLVGAGKSTKLYSALVHKVLGDGSNEQRVFAAIGLLRSVENPPAELSSTVIEAFGGLMAKNLILREGATTLNLTEAQQRAIHELTRTLGEEAAEAFALLLKDSRIDIQILGILILGIVGSRNAAELIIRTLNDSRYQYVGIAPLVLVGAPAVEPLIAALRDENEDVRERAAEALGQIGDARAVEPLIAALRDKNEDVRRRAVEGLVRSGARSVEPLIAALRDENEDVRRSVEHALAGIGADSVEPLIAALRDENKRVPWSAGLDALAGIGKSSVEPLIAALQDEYMSVRWAAANALGQTGDARAVEPLIVALRDGERFVRASAAHALERIGNTRAVEPLIAALQDEEQVVRMQAERALGQMRDARAVELLIAALRDENVHRSAQHALESIGAPSVEPLIAVLRDENEDVRGRAVEALGRIGDARAVEPLIAALRDGKGGFFAKYALEQIRAWPAVEPLIAALRDKNEDVRRNAAEALGEMDDGRAIVPLIAALRDENEDVRRSVEHVLGRMLGARALDELVQGDKKRTFWSSVRYEARKAAEKIRWRFE